MILSLRCRDGEYRIAMRQTASGYAVVEAGFAASDGDLLAEADPEQRTNPLYVWEQMIRHIDWIGAQRIRQQLEAQGLDPDTGEPQERQMTIEDTE